MNNGRYWIILVLAAAVVFTSASLSGLEAQMQPPKNLSPDEYRLIQKAKEEVMKELREAAS